MNSTLERGGPGWGAPGRKANKLWDQVGESAARSQVGVSTATLRIEGIRHEIGNRAPLGLGPGDPVDPPRVEIRTVKTRAAKWVEYERRYLDGGGTRWGWKAMHSRNRWRARYDRP